MKEMRGSSITQVFSEFCLSELFCSILDSKLVHQLAGFVLILARVFKFTISSSSHALIHHAPTSMLEFSSSISQGCDRENGRGAMLLR
jgi:hypothetical protein